MATNYKRGRAFEYRVKHALEGLGFFVVRSAGSKGPADLIAARAGYVLLVQCSTSKESKDERDKNKVIEASKEFTNGIPAMAWKEHERGPIIWEFLSERPDNILDIC